MKERPKAKGRYKLLPVLNPEEKKVPEKKVCTKCGDEKPIDEFAKNRSYKDGHVGICKTCFNEKTRDKQRENKNSFPY